MGDREESRGRRRLAGPPGLCWQACGGPAGGACAQAGAVPSDAARRGLAASLSSDVFGFLVLF